MEEIKLLDIADDLLVINKTTIEKLFQHKDHNVLILYLFYYKTAKWQKNNPIKASDEYCKKCLHWGIDKIQNTKKALKELQLIETIRRTDEKGVVVGWYIKVNYLVNESRIPETTIPTLPQLVKQETNTINNNILNTINNKDTKKEIYKEKEICKRVIDKLNELNNTRYSSTSESTLKFIKGRLKDGYTEEDLMLVVEKMSYLWHQPGEKDMTPYLRPSTLFRPTNFENYLNMPIKNKQKGFMEIMKGVRDKYDN